MCGGQIRAIRFGRFVAWPVAELVFITFILTYLRGAIFDDLPVVCGPPRCLSVRSHF